MTSAITLDVSYHSTTTTANSPPQKGYLYSLKVLDLESSKYVLWDSPFLYNSHDDARSKGMAHVRKLRDEVIDLKYNSRKLEF